MKQALILAGGKGTRLRSRLGNLPKPLVVIGGKPLLGHQLALLQQHKFTEVLVLVNYGAEQIRSYCERYSGSKLHVSLLDDGEPRGTAGAVLQIMDRLAKDFLVLYGDTMVEVDLARFWNWHVQDSLAATSLFVHPNNHPEDSDLVEMDESCRILRFHRYPHPAGMHLPNLVNAALYAVRRDALAAYGQAETPLDFAKDLFPRMLREGVRLRGYNSPEYIKDVGTPDRLDRACRDFARGVIARSSLACPQRAVLMDRDGTLNEERGHLASADNLRVFDFVGPALRLLNENEWRTVIVTNQPVLARGEATYEQVRNIHNKLETEVGRHHAFFDRIYLCPHHPDRGFAGEVVELKQTCDCRKPAIGLIKQAERDLNLDLRECWFVGDSSADLAAADAADISSILVQTGSAGGDGRFACTPDFVVSDFAAAVALIVELYPRTVELCQSVLDVVKDGSDWFVGGNPGPAQSFLAATLLRELRRRGTPCAILRLNAWPLASLEREFAPFEAPSLEDLYLELRKRRIAQANESHLPRYPDSAWVASHRNLPVRTVIIWEGTSALQLARKLDMSDRCISVGAPIKVDAETSRPSMDYVVNLDEVFAGGSALLSESLH